MKCKKKNRKKKKNKPQNKKCSLRNEKNVKN